MDTTETKELNVICISILKKAISTYEGKCLLLNKPSGIGYLGRNVSFNLIGYSLSVHNSFDIDLFITTIIDSVTDEYSNTSEAKKIHDLLMGYRILERRNSLTTKILHWCNIF